MPSMLPLVTVLIPAYNAESTIRRALDSASAQDYPTLEVIVVDNGSIDATSDVVAGYRQPEIRLLNLPCHQEDGGVLNEGIAIAKGEYIAFLDSGDEWLPQKLSRQITALEGNAKAMMATCGYRLVDHCTNLTEEFGMRPQQVPRDQIWRSLLAAAFITKSCIVARASAFRQVGLFDTTISVAADRDMWIRLAMAGEVEFVDEFLAIAHDTPDSLARLDGLVEDKYSPQRRRRHVVHRRDRLSNEEIRHILCKRYAAPGRSGRRAGRVWRRGRLRARTIMPDDNKGENLGSPATTSPPANPAKTMLPPKAEATLSRPSPLPRHSRGNALLTPPARNLVEIPSGPPILIVAVDLEAEFDWFGPRLRTHHSVHNVREQTLAHKIFDNFGIRPTYLVDYAAATQANGYGPLREWVASRKCEIGAHLQAWENPPFAEELGERTSYNHNLPAWLQKEKLHRLTEAIRSNIGVQPVIYRAGRYGIGEEMARILRSFDYRIDMSVLPGTNLSRQHGPDFRRVFNRPYWFGRDRDLLEIPLTVGFCGLFSSPALPQALTVDLYDRLSRPRVRRLNGPGFFARLGLLERITLTPEGISIQEMKRLTRNLLARGNRVLSLNYHSSSLLPGYTPYVRNAGDLDHFLGKIASYLETFFGEFQGISMTPGEFHATISELKRAAGNETPAASFTT